MALMMHQRGLALPVRASRPSVAVNAVKVDKKGARVEQVLGATAGALLVAQPALAADDVPVDSAIDSIIAGVKASGEVIKSTISTVEAGVQIIREGIDVAAPVVEQAVKVATPVVQEAVKVTADAAGPAIKAALPSLKEAVEAGGLNTKAVADATSVVTSTASTAVTTATPFITKFLQFLAQQDPVTLAEYGVAGLVVLYLAPGLLGLVGGSFRGFAGELAPAAALDLLVNEGNVVLIDVRTVKEKENSGVPDLPSAANGKSLEVEYAVTEDKKLRGQLRDPSAIEAQVTALQIAALKKISKGSKVILLDRYGPAARTVAKELGRKGYGKVYVVAGGFDGRGGWVQSKLQIKPAATLISAAPPSIAKTVFTRGRALPAPRS